jgi:hypothetical protein
LSRGDTNTLDSDNHHQSSSHRRAVNASSGLTRASILIVALQIERGHG